MKVTIPEITDAELSVLLKNSGMEDDEISSFFRYCENKYCCAEKMRILRKARKLLLDRIHEKQAQLDQLDNLIWCTEQGGGV